MWWVIPFIKFMGAALVLCAVYDNLFKRGRSWGNRYIRPRYLGPRGYGYSRVASQAARIARTLDQDVQNKRTGTYEHHNDFHHDHHE